MRTFLCAVFSCLTPNYFYFRGLEMFRLAHRFGVFENISLAFFFIRLLSLTFLKSIHIPPGSGQFFIVGQFIFLVGGHWLLTLATGPPKREREQQKKSLFVLAPIKCYKICCRRGLGWPKAATRRRLADSTFGRLVFPATNLWQPGRVSM